MSFPLLAPGRPLLLSFSRVGPIWAGAGVGPDALGLRTARRPGLWGGRDSGDVTNQPDVPPGPPARSQAVENALRTGVVGGAHAYGRKPRSPARGRRPAVWGHINEARGVSA